MAFVRCAVHLIEETGRCSSCKSKGTPKLVEQRTSKLEQRGDARPGPTYDGLQVLQESRMQVVSSWFTSLMKQKSRVKAQWDAMKFRTAQAQIKCRVQVPCSSAELSCFSERLIEIEETPTTGAEEESHSSRRTLKQTSLENISNEESSQIKREDRGTLRSEDDEDHLKSGCKREEKKRALNKLDEATSSKTRPAQCKPERRKAAKSGCKREEKKRALNKLDEATSSKTIPAQCKPERRKAAKVVKVKPAQIS
ncbi:hypothetical protein F511_33374 [Dorcoceras hygrometricum]|uniref:Uncharacterized protein n=1 Tax=Dorcoceras hygrometricum TaxID=472368 RepID=A0A2Z7C3U8_9LAMI|nr:hypothetical protein F511_33374 [Dorcoceras hygrometricum]